MRRSSVTLISAIALSLGSCQFKKDSDDDKVSAAEIRQVIQQQDTQNQENAAAVLTNDNVKIQFTAEDEPNTYKLEINWPLTVPKIAISIDDRPLGDFSKGTFSKIFEGGTTVGVRLDSKNSQGHIVSTVIQSLKAPRDLVLERSVTLKSDEKWIFGRIFVLPGVTIFTMGYSLEIVSELLKSQSSRIMTFPELLPTSNTRELTNGHILIQAKKLTGTLDVRLYGQHGLKGADGIDKVTAQMPKEGAKGADGVAGEKAMSELGSCEGGGGFRNPNRFRTGCGGSWYCSKQATNGGEGGKGADGLPGDNGMNGGHSGNITFVVEDYSQARVDIFMSGGRAGAGGLGQPGYAGGEGGKGGAGVVEAGQQLCEAGKDGAKGAAGNAGANGLPGEPGKIGEAILPRGDTTDHFRVIRE